MIDRNGEGLWLPPDKIYRKAVKEVSDMYGGENADLVDLYMRIGCLHNEIANFGIIKLP